MFNDTYTGHNIKYLFLSGETCTLLSIDYFYSLCFVFLWLFPHPVFTLNKFLINELHGICMCVCACVHVCLSVCTYVHIYACTSVHMYIHMYACMYVGMHVCMHASFQI